MLSELFPRRTSGWHIAVAATAVTVAATVLAPIGSSAAASPTASASAVTWTPCRDGFQCARVAVPLDYDYPAGASISLSLVRLPASAPSHRIGSLFLNPGGPGGSGTEFARAIGKYLPLEIRAHFDVVGFDPRGIHDSTPVRCYDTFEQALTDLAPFSFPVTNAEEEVQRVADRKLTAACARHGGAILRHMSTADVARDLDLLRQKLGDSRLTYLGFSYGSVLGQTYANLFPGKVRALVIDGVVDPIAWSTGRGNEGTKLPFSTRLRSDVGAQKTLGEFFRLCDAAGPDCAFAGASAKRYAKLTERLRRHPIQIVDPDTGELFTLTYADVVATTLVILYQAAVWSDAAVLLADVEDQVFEQPEAAGRVARDLAAVRRAVGAEPPEQETYPNDIEGSPSVACSDSVNPTRFAAWPNAADVTEREHGYFGRAWTWTWSACAAWPMTDRRDRHLGPWTARTASPVLVVGNYFDPATRYEGAVTASKLLPNSRLLSYAGWGHAAFFIASNYCVDSRVTDYLVSKRLPAAGTVCRPEGSPFGPTSVSAARRKAAARVTGALLPASLRRVIGGR